MGQQRKAAAAEVFNQQNMMLGDNFDVEEDEAVGFEEVELSAYPAQSALAGGLLGRARALPSTPASGPSRDRAGYAPMSSLKTSEELQLEKEPIQVRVTGIWFWKRVIVPPNAYVVHTRLGRSEPVTIGLGRSFRYNSDTDAYLVVPAAMQTIGVVANSITQEKQGINILAYVQWQISDFSIAYRKLDVTDPRDPLGIVNAQLREQAEAAIKDKIATMSVEDVLTDKAPIIEELTRRLIEVTEGRLQTADNATGEGLGIRIVTVQIKEARVSSQRLWEHLQAPYRHEQEKQARLSYLEMREQIRSKELVTRQITETSEAETQVEIARIKQTKETEGLELRLVEEEKRYAREQTTARQKIQLEEDTTLVAEESQRRLAAERARLQQEALMEQLTREQQQAIERARLQAETTARQTALRIEQQLSEMQEELRLAQEQARVEQERWQRDATLKQAEHEYLTQSQTLENQREQQRLDDTLNRERQTTLTRLELQEAHHQTVHRQHELDERIARLQQETRNLISDSDLQRILLERLPELAAQLPKPDELRVLQSNGNDLSGLTAFITMLMGAIDAARSTLGTNDTNPEA